MFLQTPGNPDEDDVNCWDGHANNDSRPPPSENPNNTINDTTMTATKPVTSKLMKLRSKTAKLQDREN